MRPSLNHSARMAALLGLLVPLLVLSAVPGPGSIALAAGAISGVVYQDYNADGVRNTVSTPALPAVDRPIAGVTVTATCVTARGADGVLGTPDDTVTSYPAVTSDALGAYTIGLTAQPPITPTAAELAAGQRACRVEFSTLPAGFQPGAIGADDGSSVQFVNDGDTASFGVNRPADYCQNNPTLYTTCYALDNASTGPYKDRTVLIDFPYSAGAPAATATAAPYDVPTAHTVAVPYQQIGATYGLAVRHSTGEVFTAAYLKNATGFGPGGPAAIYKLSSNTTASVFADLNTAFGPDAAGADPHTAYGPDTSASFDVDAGAIPLVGRRSFGDLDILEDPANAANDALYVVNLFDRQLYRVALNATNTISRFPIPTNIPNGLGNPCAAADVRPFGLGTHLGLVYLGLVCSAESTQVDAEVSGSIVTFDPATDTFSAAPVLNVALSYPRGNVYSPSAGPGAINYPARWRPWVSSVDFATWMLDTNDGATVRPQPMISDITFDGNNMLIGIRDRGPDMYAGEASASLPNGKLVFPFGVTAGDLLRACGTNGTSWTLESNAACPPGGAATGGAGNNQGPGGGEFYFQENAPRTGALGGSIHDQMALGALVQIPGYPDIAATTTDPIRIPNELDDAGVSWYSNTVGTEQRAYRVYDSNGVAGNGTFGKAGGLGDLDVLCNSAPIEVGNRVWIDSNGNGQQDAGERPIAGVTVRIYDAAGKLLDTAVTDASGSYRFSSNSGTSTTSARYGVSLKPNGDYDIRLDNPADYQTGGPLEDYALTQVNVGGDTIDSDGTLTTNPVGSPSGRFPTTAVRTGGAGANNHTYDFGFVTSYSLGNQIWFDTDNSGTINGGEVGVAAVSVSLFADVNADGVPDSVTPLSTVTTDSGGFYRFDGLAAGNYVVRVNPTNFMPGGVLNGYLGSTPTETDPNLNGDSNDNGLPTTSAPTNGVSSGSIRIGPGLQPSGETEPAAYGAGSTDGTAAPDGRSNLTVDFGFFQLTLGNQLWYDVNNNGFFEPGTDITLPAGVRLELRDSATGALIAVTTTDANGRYLFTGLQPGSYYVNIPGGQPALNGYVPSLVPGGIIDSKNNGTLSGQDVRSGAYVLVPGSTNIGQTVNTPRGATDQPTVDFGFVRNPTAVTLASLTARRTAETVVISWVTTSELNTLGFRVLRSATGSLADAAEVTGTLVPGQGAQGGSYSWTDREAGTGAFSYWLVEQETGGTLTTYGPVRIGGTAGVGRLIYLPLVQR